MGQGQRGLPRTAGHKAGEAALFDVVEGAIEIGVDWRVGLRLLDRELEALAGRGALPDGLQPRRHPAPPRRDARAGRAGPLGRPAPAAVAQRHPTSSRTAEELTRDNDVLTLTMCVNYGGRAEIADAAAALARDVRRRPARPGRRSTRRLFARYLDEPDMPDVDLFMRTVGRAADLQLPALAVGVRRAGLPRHAVAGLRPAATCGGRSRSTPDRDRRYGVAR